MSEFITKICTKCGIRFYGRADKMGTGYVCINCAPNIEPEKDVVSEYTTTWSSNDYAFHTLCRICNGHMVCMEGKDNICDQCILRKDEKMTEEKKDKVFEYIAFKVNEDNEPKKILGRGEVIADDKHSALIKATLEFKDKFGPESLEANLINLDILVRPF